MAPQVEEATAALSALLSATPTSRQERWDLSEDTAPG